MIIPNDLEQLRVYSSLSEQLHYIDVDGAKYACFAGNIVPYSMVGAFLIWAWTGSKVYQGLYRETDMLDTIKDLNLHDEKIVSSPADAPWYLAKKLRKVMKTWDEVHFDNIFEQALI